ncbi:putative DNA-binding protein YlxM (UPF0122 family) [Neobacillus niacini]|uniref:hypothetical protein n=1 Tax=Neobacillus niacini TaxID=86668 RepID=UPI002784EACD|nr:hypothetical protein [Neobacillus niacini]MDQ1005212.1 putative DNA-binding protein YlxM (UPF0122 family) [Neobacillus niacini]
MGSIDHIEQLETYIKDLGDEIKNVKKASDYLKLIEQFQDEVRRTSTTLTQSEAKLQLIQGIVESKLALFQATANNIDSKQQSIEQSQSNIIAGLAELKQFLEKSEKGMISSFIEINKLMNETQSSVISELKTVKDENEAQIKMLTKTNKIFFRVNLTFVIIVVGMLIFLLGR